MTVEIANALYRYFEALYELNQNVIILCGTDVLDSRSQYIKQIEKVIHLVPKLIPYKFNKRDGIYKLENGDGLLEFEDDMPFIRVYYEDILKNHIKFLENIKKIRNKLEHKMHGAKVVASSDGSSCLFEIVYDIKGNRVEIKAVELINFLKEINNLFYEIQKSVIEFINKKHKSEYEYYIRITRVYFNEFNKIYESNLLRLFGKVLLPF